MGVKRVFLIIGLFILFSNMVYAAKLVPYLILPNSSINVTPNQFFNFTTGVRCEGGDCGNVTAILDPNAVYNPSLGVPYCETAESPCIAGSNLLMSRDSVDFPEPNQPNTLDGCMDDTSTGPGGVTYKITESVENVTIRSLNGTTFKFGDIVEVEAWVYCWPLGSDYDQISFVYKNDTNSDWRVITYYEIYCPYVASGVPVPVKWNITLDNVLGNHTIRTGILYSPYQWPPIACDTTAQGNEYDDLTFYVQGPKGVIPMNSGIPFYTTTQNPTNYSYHNCLQNMHDGDSCNITWQVNATGELNSTWDFFTIYQSDDVNVASNETGKVAVTIVEELAEEPPVEEPIKFNITLINGWNLISFPLNLTDKLVSSVMNGVSYSRIFTYSETWKELVGSNSFNESKAYWINSSASQILAINGTEFNSFNLSLTKGWNFIGYPSLNSSLLNETLINYSVVYGYNNSDWLSNVKSRNESLNTLKQLNPGYGYWLNSKENTSLIFS